MNRSPWAAALGMAFVLSFALAFLRPDGRQSVDTDFLSGPAEETRSDDDLLPDRAENAAIGEQQQAVQTAIAEQPVPPPVTPALQDLDLIPPIPEFEETVRGFASQTDDVFWSDATESHIFGQISQATGLGASDIQVDCRTTLCRVQLSNPQSALNPRYRSLNELVDTFGLETLWLWAAPDRDGNTVNLAYLQRDGTATTETR